MNNPENEMSQAYIQLAYDGPALRDGSMDVRDLAPALLAIGELCEKASQLVNDDRAEVSVRIKSDFKTGSFEVHIDVFQKLLQAAKTLLQHKDQISSAKEILEIIGLVAGAGAASLFKVVKWLKGKRATKSTVLQSGNILIEVKEARIEIPPELFILLNNDGVREALRGVVKPLEKPGIDTFEVREGDKAVEIVTKEDLPYFEALESNDAPEKLIEGARDAALQIIKPSFQDDLKWVFSDGHVRFSAEMKDKGFLRRLDRREVAFSKGDLIEANVASRTFRTSRGLSTEYEILQVKRIIPAARQESLLPPPTEDDKIED